ncbi:MAG: FMN-binding negative transcriptional regulator [Hyphomicrobiales bacterium]|nr:FMN-binding negative transcriptional regulator [Hyphomicrobiales bacterium]
MYVAPSFAMSDPVEIRAAIEACGLAQLVTAGATGLACTPLPLLFDANEGDFGTLYGHMARANPQWRETSRGEALAIFMGPDAYVSPSWYPSKRRDGRVVPTWNYTAVHVYGRVDFIDDAERLREVVRRLTDRREGGRAEPWSIDDAPADFVAAQLRGIVGVRLVVTRIEAKRKMSQNRTAEDRAGVKTGLAASADARDRAASEFVPE